MSFESLWSEIDKKKRITESDKKVSMTPKQFKHMLKQFYDQGVRQGEADGIKLSKQFNDTLNSSSGKNGKSFPFDGGDYGDLFNTLFGKK